MGLVSKRDLRLGFSLYKPGALATIQLHKQTLKTRETKQENGCGRFLLQQIIQTLCSSVGGIPSQLGLCSHWSRRVSPVVQELHKLSIESGKQDLLLQKHTVLFSNLCILANYLYNFLSVLKLKMEQDLNDVLSLKQDLSWESSK